MEQRPHCFPKLAHIQVSLSAMDQTASQKVEHASPVQARIDAVEKLSTLGFDTCMRSGQGVDDISRAVEFVESFLPGFGCLVTGFIHGLAEEGLTGELVIYDKIPGGAGHLKRIIENLEGCIKESYQKNRLCKNDGLSHQWRSPRKYKERRPAAH